MTGVDVGAPPSVAVVVPVHGGPEGLRRLVAALVDLEYPRDRIQGIIAVDGPDAELAEIAATWADDVVVLPENRGSYAARNAALTRIDGRREVVLFTDADATVTPSWVSAHLRALATADISAGHVEVTFASDEPTAAELVDSVRFLDQRRLAEGLGYAATANMAVRRDVVERLRFNPALRSGGDRDFGTRARHLGFSIVYTPDAVVRHPARPTIRQLLRKVVRVSRGIAEMERMGLLQPPIRPYHRPSAVDVARQRVPAAPRSWLWAVRILDVSCSVLWATSAPASVLPAIRRRLDRMRGRASEITTVKDS